MTQLASPKLIEVYFMEDAMASPTTDIVFSEAEAQALLIDFYNQKRLAISPEVPLIENYEALLTFKSAHPDWPSKAWYEYADAPNVDNTLTLETSQPSSSPPALLVVEHLRVIGEHLQEILQFENIHLPTTRIQELLTEAYERSLVIPAPQKIDLEKFSLEDSTDTVWLIQIGDEDLAVYLDANYIDSASKRFGESHQDIIETAQMFVEKYKATLKKHHFKHLPEGWGWTDVDKIMHKSGLFPNAKTPLMAALQTAKTIKMNDIIVQSFEFYDEAYQNYISHGDIDAVLLKLIVKKADHIFDVYLTVEEIANATQVKPNQWVCFDFGATELVINHHSPELSINSLLR